MQKIKQRPPNLQASGTSLVDDTRGLSSVEYIILLVVIAVGGIAVWNSIGEKVVNKADQSNNALKALKAPTSTSAPASY